MEKLDLKKQYKALYSGKPGVIQELEVPELPYIMIDGEGNPNTSKQFAESVSHLYGLAYTMKFMISKADKANDYVVGPLQGLWWCPDMAEFSVDKKDAWLWTLMIVQPAVITNDVFAAGLEAYMHKKKLAFIPALRFEHLREGKVVQSLHIGPYSAEAPLIAKMHAHIQKEGHTLTGKHHEIYLSNPEKTAPEKMKTILRQPFL